MDDPIMMYGVRTPDCINLDVPVEIINTQNDTGTCNLRASHECPYCAIPWYIAGAYNKSEEGLQGKSLLSMYTCYRCQRVGVPRVRE